MPRPPELRELQAAFARAVAGNAAAVADFVREDGIPVADRVGVYANNARLTFLTALALTFPAVQRLGGVEWFAGTVSRFRARHPSRSGDLHWAGAGFATFLAEQLAGTGHEVIGDVAALEWAYAECEVAPDAPPLDFAALAAVPPERHGALVFDAHPACRRVASRYPVVDVWTANRGDAEPGEIDLDGGGQHALVCRRGLEVEVHRVDAAGFAFLEELAAGATLTEAAEQAAAIVPDFPLASELTRYVRLGVLVRVRLPDA